MKYILGVLYAPIYVFGGLLYFIFFALTALADILARDTAFRFDWLWVFGRYGQSLAFFLLLNPRIALKLSKNPKDRQ